MSTNTWATPEKIAGQMKREIIADVKAGKFTADQITGFSDLHDYVDANLYAFENDLDAAAELFPPMPDNYAEYDTWWETAIDLANDAQYYVNKWIQDGGLRASTSKTSSH